MIEGSIFILNMNGAWVLCVVEEEEPQIKLHSWNQDLVVVR